MKKIIIISACIVLAMNLIAQNTGIGTTNPEQNYDIAAANPALPTNQEGILIPRITVFPVTHQQSTKTG